MNRSPLAIDPAAELRRIETFLRETLTRMKRRGLVVGVSGGVDSAVCAAVAVRALGPEKVFALMMPEAGSADDGGTGRAARLCRSLGVHHAIEDVTDALAAIGCYRQAEAAIRRMIPEYGPGWRHKVVLAGGGIPHFRLVAQSPGGRTVQERMPADVYLQVVAATNYKQRVRKSVEYFHAERLNAAVLGTPNRLEYQLGFFVRGGDGLADLKPIAHLYKTQVYALAEFLGIPDEIRQRPPSTDTYGLPQTQEEFYFALPWDKADLVLYAMDAGLSAEDTGAMVGLTATEVERVWTDFAGKRRVAARTLADAYTIDEAA
ncbi:MAG: NAD(+) synthase [Solirubrobacterales bacterium]